MKDSEIKQLESILSCVYTISDYAKHVGLTPPRIHQLIQAKELKTMKISGKTFVVSEV